MFHHSNVCMKKAFHEQCLEDLNSGKAKHSVTVLNVRAAVLCILYVELGRHALPSRSDKTGMDEVRF